MSDGTDRNEVEGDAGSRFENGRKDDKSCEIRGGFGGGGAGESVAFPVRMDLPRSPLIVNTSEEDVDIHKMLDNLIISIW